MTFDEFLTAVRDPARPRFPPENKPIPLSDAYQKLLQVLWGNGGTYPRDWVSTQDLLRATGSQSETTRRLRQLRGEYGIDLGTAGTGKEAGWRLESSELGPFKPRKNFTKAQRASVYKRAGFCCQVCGRSFEPGHENLQVDHKVPLYPKGGHHVMDNFQALCVNCNVSKRRACHECELECSTCAWAFPEAVGVVVPVRLEVSDYRAIRSRDSRVAERIGDWVSAHLEDLIPDESDR